MKQVVSWKSIFCICPEAYHSPNFKSSLLLSQETKDDAKSVGSDYHTYVKNCHKHQHQHQHQETHNDGGQHQHQHQELHNGGGSEDSEDSGEVDAAAEDSQAYYEDEAADGRK